MRIRIPVPLRVLSPGLTRTPVPSRGRPQPASHVAGDKATAIPRLLELMVLTRCIVTIDAMGCRTKIAEQIVETTERDHGRVETRRYRPLVNPEGVPRSTEMVASVVLTLYFR
jgi:hypothetical protein